MLAFLVMPVKASFYASILMTIVFVGLPIYALFRATEGYWTVRRAGVWLGIGALLHVVAVLATSPGGGVGNVFLAAVQQTGILFWTLGLGAALGTMIKDKNMMIPVAVFLIGFDMFLVFNPQAPTARFMREHPELVSAVVATVPEVKKSAEPTGTVQNLAYIGPADFLFSAAFFLLMHRFGMRTKRTLCFLLPVLSAYLLIVVAYGWVTIGPLSLAMLPAMVPIGLTVVLVNRREFKFSGQEIAGIVVVALISAGLAGYGIYRASSVTDAPPEPPAAPSLSEPSLEGTELEGSPPPISAD